MFAFISGFILISTRRVRICDSLLCKRQRLSIIIFNVCHFTIYRVLNVIIPWNSERHRNKHNHSWKHVSERYALFTISLLLKNLTCPTLRGEGEGWEWVPYISLYTTVETRRPGQETGASRFLKLAIQKIQIPIQFWNLHEHKSESHLLPKLFLELVIIAKPGAHCHSHIGWRIGF